jgi:hypothetical protein
LATFLSLCADLARESGAVGTPPASVINQTGRQAKCVEWVRQGWRAIQTDNPDYSFLRSEIPANQALVVGTTIYTPAALGISSFARWYPDMPGYRPFTIYESGAQAQENTLAFISYESWRERYNRGVHDPNRPVHYSVAPDRSLVVGPAPDKAYIIRGEYQRGPQTLVADGDIPIMPEQYHDAITWRAAMMLAAHDEAPFALQSATLKYLGFIYDMARDLLPEVSSGGNALG